MPTLQQIQHSFAAGELDPALYQRVDLAKVHVGARKLLNWIVHTKGGASNRAGFGWVGELIDSGKAGRLIPFQFSTTQTYVLEFGDFKLRFITGGGYVTESPITITGITQANPGVVSYTGDDPANGDRIYVVSVGGMTQVNGRYFTVAGVNTGANTFQLQDTAGNNVNTTGYGTYTSGGTWARLYTVATPYAYADLPLLKFEQSQDTMTLLHRSYAPRKLVRTGSVAWTLSIIVFAPKQAAPTGVTSSAGGSSHFYAVTAINDDSGEESLQSADAGSSSQTSTLTWAALTDCSQYNVYKRKNGVYGFIGTAQTQPTGGTVSFADNTIDPNTTITPPQQRNPFASGGIESVTVDAGGSGYVSPTLTVSDPSGNGNTASLTANLTGDVITSVTVNDSGRGLTNPTIVIGDGTGGGASLQINWTPDGGEVITGMDGEGNPVYSPTYQVASVTVLSGGSGYGSGASIQLSPAGYGSGAILTPVTGAGAVTSVTVTAPGSGYANFPYNYFPTATVIDSAGSGAVLTPVLSFDSTANPGTTAYHDGRQWFAATNAKPQTLWASVAGSFNSMAVSTPTQDNDALTRTLASRQVNEIRHMVSLSQMIILTSGAEWKLSAGSSDVITPAQVLLRPQSYNGSSNIRPILANDVLLYIIDSRQKVRGLQYQWAADTWTGPEYTLLASHLLEQGLHIVNWAHAREPDGIIWAVRDDGALLGFTFNSEQQVYAWHVHTTTNGSFEDVCVVQEGDESAVYVIVRRTISGQTRRYVERLHSRVYATIADAWFLDSALQYSGAAATTIAGLWHLVGEEVYALADGVVRGPFTVSATGTITLETAASVVTVGKRYTCDLETLGADLQDQRGTVQGRKKKINAVTVGLKNSADKGLTVGPSGGQGAPVLYEIKGKDLANPLAAAPSSNPALITDLMHGVQAPSWDWYGRTLIRATQPLPYTVTGVMYDVTT
jgi:hypothetical protein